MKTIFTENAATPGGHYSQAVIHGGMVYLAGQLPITPKGEKKLGSIEEQTLQVLENVKSILEAANSGIDRVIRATIYISDMSLWDQVNAVYTDFFAEHKPARAIVPTRDLHYGFKIEMEVIAAEYD